jgi:hypothetical protein
VVKDGTVARRLAIDFNKVVMCGQIVAGVARLTIRAFVKVGRSAKRGQAL